jgi:hypothetical protein
MRDRIRIGENVFRRDSDYPVACCRKLIVAGCIEFGLITHFMADSVDFKTGPRRMAIEVDNVFAQRMLVPKL